MKFEREKIKYNTEMIVIVHLQTGFSIQTEI